MGVRKGKRRAREGEGKKKGGGWRGGRNERWREEEEGVKVHSLTKDIHYNVCGKSHVCTHSSSPTIENAL